MMDKIFDSLNSLTFVIPSGKIYKGAVKTKSPHHNLWIDTIKMLKSIKFFIINKKVRKLKGLYRLFAILLVPLKGYSLIGKFCTKNMVLMQC